MAQKTVSLPAVRIEPVYRDALEGIASGTRPELSVSALVRLAVVEFIERRTAGRSTVDGEAISV